VPVEHYENFPVASWLLPARMRRSVAVLYHFARSADDLADEGDAGPQQRLAELNEYRSQLDLIAAGCHPTSPQFIDLAETVQQHKLPLELLYDLLDAFSQDVVKKRFANFDELLEYCRRSANPVGRLLLTMARQDSSRQLEHSDFICTALQLINFWQDIAIDWQKGRLYLPIEDLQRFDINETDIETGRIDGNNWRPLIRFQCARARELMLRGAPLCSTLPGRLGWEIRLTVQGGLRILELIEAADCDVFRHRPHLEKRDWLLIFWRALKTIILHNR